VEQGGLASATTAFDHDDLGPKRQLMAIEWKEDPT